MICFPIEPETIANDREISMIHCKHFIVKVMLSNLKKWTKFTLSHIKGSDTLLSNFFSLKIATAVVSELFYHHKRFGAPVELSPESHPRVSRRIHRKTSPTGHKVAIATLSLSFTTVHTLSSLLFFHYCFVFRSFFQNLHKDYELSFSVST